VLYLYCGYENQSFAKSCNSCKKDISPSPGMKGHLGQLLRAAEYVLDGNISHDEFETVVAKMEDITGQVADDFRVPIEDDKEVAGSVNDAQRGILLTSNALKEFRGYLEIKEKAPLLRGMDRIKEAYEVSSKSYGHLKKLKEAKEAEEGAQ